ncbi:Uncharacterized protein dnm_060000 [Desulfonema magnum]|uniref:Uncharacterized protein n=1 Tax=Desulfonema magnum TaxID=45655 RepID=A0A975BQR2_9BACT|nr:Uncharacterized protein dnm_060000 [Desulfonema magnum]
MDKKGVRCLRCQVLRRFPTKNIPDMFIFENRLRRTKNTGKSDKILIFLI